MKNEKAKKLKNLLKSDKILKVAGAHDALSAKLAEQIGFDAIWASGFGISSVAGVPDASILTMTEFLQAAAYMNDSIEIPLIADCDTGYGGIYNIMHMVKKYERAGIAGVCIEDKIFPKINSFEKGRQELLDVDEFCGKIKAAILIRKSQDFMVIARCEALIAGLGMKEMLKRIHRYCEAGADAVVVHSKAKTPIEVLECIRKIQYDVPVVLIPTSYPELSVSDLSGSKVKMLIYANQALRASVTIMKDVYEKLYKDDKGVYDSSILSSMDEIFNLQGFPQMRYIENLAMSKDKKYEGKTAV